MTMTTCRGHAITRRHYPITVNGTRMQKVLLVELRTCNGFGLSRQWRGIALHLGDKSGGLDLVHLVRVLFVPAVPGQ